MSSLFYDPGDAGDASRDAAQLQVQFQREALDYMKEREALPRQYSEQALQRLGGIYGLTGDTGAQERMIQQAIESPLYGAIMSGQEAGEEAIMRSAAQTGGLRSGTTQEALYDYNTQLQNQALLQSYNEQLSGIQGMAGLPSNAGQIAQMTSGIGQTLAQGIIGAEQSTQMAQNNQFSNLLGLAGLGMLGFGMFSDRRLKTKIKRIGEVANWNWYSWEWNKVAEKMGLKGKCQGCMAEEVFTERPDAVILKDLFMFVLYPKIGVFCNG